uniref:Small ribosomal subunit protein mS40 n=1 Tax=Labrus bergylta TaxID=56723 RepID=A0A3Q3FB18_9LABR
MAASMHGAVKVLCRLSPSITLPLRRYQRLPVRLPVRPCPGVPPCRFYSSPASLHDEETPQAAEAQSRYKDKPWEYLESEGEVHRQVWNQSSVGWVQEEPQRRDPPQKTRKTCIRGDKVCGNPCPICRDPKVVIHHQNVKLLQQFISPHTGEVYDPTRTGVCMKQQKKLTEAINTSRDHGLLPFQIPYVEFLEEDYSNSHDAVGSTPPAPSLMSGDSWYTWYGDITPDEGEVAKVKKTYRAYLK